MTAVRMTLVAALAVMVLAACGYEYESDISEHEACIDASLSDLADGGDGYDC